VLAQERVIRPTRDRIGVEGRLPPPAREGTDRALAAQVRDDQCPIDTLRGKQLVLGEGLETREPVVIEPVARRKSIRGEISETMIVRVDARDAGRDGIERVAPVDEVVGVLAEARELERLSAVRAELGVGGIWPSAVAAVGRRAGCSRRGRRCRPSGHGPGLVVRGFVPEATHALAQLAKNVRQFPRAEDDQHDRQDE
jgi:hypothetical protein